MSQRIHSICYDRIRAKWGVQKTIQREYNENGAYVIATDNMISDNSDCVIINRRIRGEEGDSLAKAN